MQRERQDDQLDGQHGRQNGTNPPPSRRYASTGTCGEAPKHHQGNAEGITTSNGDISGTNRELARNRTNSWRGTGCAMPANFNNTSALAMGLHPTQRSHLMNPTTNQFHRLVTHKTTTSPPHTTGPKAALAAGASSLSLCADGDITEAPPHCRPSRASRLSLCADDERMDASHCRSFSAFRIS